MARPRGFALWKPKDETLRLLDDVEHVLEEYEAHLPLTVRQIFYRLVGQYGFDKTEQAYERLCGMLVRARRAGMIRFDVIRDDGTAGGFPQTFDDVLAFWKGVRDDLEHYSRDRLTGQDVRIEVWCEAAGMVPQLRRVAYPYSVGALSTGGFSGLTVIGELAVRALLRPVPTVFLHCGDYDPSGDGIFAAQSEDARKFVYQVTHARNAEGRDALAKVLGIEGEEVCDGAALIPVRVALTREQVREHDLPTSPPKRSDSRTANWEGDETCQLEAMPPELLASTVRAAIRERLDMGRFEEEVEREEADKQQIAQGIAAAEELGS